MAQDKQYEIDKNYLKLAIIQAEKSKAIRNKVGALVVKNDMIISNGINGMPPNMSNECEYLEDNDNPTREELLKAVNEGKKLITKDAVIHAEMNSLMKMAKWGISCEGATMYCSVEPCVNCAKHIIMAGIKRVVYSNSYRLHDGIELLMNMGIEVKQIK